MPFIRGKNILVSGGAGFIGSHLVDSLVDENPGSLIVVDNLFLGKEENLQYAVSRFSNLKFYKQDASDYEAMKEVIANNSVDVIFNLAVIPLPKSLEAPGWTIRENINMTTTLCELGREGYFKTLIQFSSSEIYGTAQKVPMAEDHPSVPLTPYAASKMATDHIALSYRETFGLDVAVVRPFNNYGPRQNDKSYAGVIPIVINNVLSDRPVEIFGDGLQTRDFLYVADTARAAVQIYKNERTRGEVINVASGRETTINDLVKHILDIMKAGKHEVVHVTPRPGDVRRHCGDIALARDLIDFAPTVDIYKGLEETVQWYVQKKR